MSDQEVAPPETRVKPLMVWNQAAHKPPENLLVLLFSEKYRIVVIGWNDGSVIGSSAERWGSRDPRFQNSYEPDGVIPISHWMPIPPFPPSQRTPA